MLNLDPPRLFLFYSFRQKNKIRLGPNLWRFGTDESVRGDEGTMGTGIFLCPLDNRACEFCPHGCKCGKGVGSGVQASLGTILMRHEAAAERAKNGF